MFIEFYIISVQLGKILTSILDVKQFLRVTKTNLSNNPINIQRVLFFIFFSANVLFLKSNRFLIVLIIQVKENQAIFDIRPFQTTRMTCQHGPFLRIDSIILSNEKKDTQLEELYVQAHFETNTRFSQSIRLEQMNKVLKMRIDIMGFIVCYEISNRKNYN